MRRLVIVSLLGALTSCSILIDLSGLSGEPLCDGGCSDQGATDAAFAPDAFDGRAPDGAGSSPIAFEQSTTVRQIGVTIGATINPTASGNLVVVALTQNTSASAKVTGVSDDAPGGSNAYVSAGQRSADVSCNNTAEIWYAKDVGSGAKNVSVTMSGSSAVEVWVLEVSGLGTTAPLESGAVIGDQPASTQVAAPQVTTAARALVVSTVATCGEVKSLAAGSPFIELPTQNGHDTAYFIAPTGGSYGATWVTTSFTWNASTVAFH